MSLWTTKAQPCWWRRIPPTERICWTNPALRRPSARARKVQTRASQVPKNIVRSILVQYYLVLLYCASPWLPLIQTLAKEVDSLRTDLFTHSRSKLPNLRMLNAKLSNSLEQTSQTFEQWQLGELIYEPLNDRLRFVMIDLPFLRNMYTQNGYKAGLELEDAFEVNSWKKRSLKALLVSITSQTRTCFTSNLTQTEIHHQRRCLKDTILDYRLWTQA